MWRKHIQLTVLAVLLAVVGLRPLIGESFSASGMRMTAALLGTRDPWAATTLVLDAIMVVAFAVLLLVDGRRAGWWRRTGLAWGAVVWVGAAVVSTWAAADKRPAINASFDFFAAILLCMALAGLLNRAWKVRLALYVVVASASVYAVACMDEVATFAETEARYNANREAFWSQQGIALDSPRVRGFEARMHAREAGGFFAHSNLAGGYQVLGGFAALALAAGVWCVRREHMIALVIALVTAAAIFTGAWLTHSTGALVGGVVGAVVLGLRMGVPRWFEHRRRVLIVGWTLALGAVGGAVTVGFVRGGLPGASLDFRWHYWITSLDMLTDCWPTGVGAENFGDAYLAYKPITSSEEIKNPHNILVQFATEYGALGLLSAVMMLVGGSLAVTQPRATERRGVGHNDASAPATSTWLMWCAGLAVLIFAPRLLLLPSGDTDYLVYMTTTGMMVWCSVFVLNALSNRSVPSGWSVLDAIASGVNCGLLALVVHDMSSFTLSVPGARMVFFSMVAIAVAARQLDGHDSRRSSHRGAGHLGWRVGGAIVLVAVCGLVLYAPVRAEIALHRARQAATAGRLAEALADYRGAVALDPLDRVAPAELSRFLATRANESTSRLDTYAKAIAAMTTAIERAPRTITLWRSRMRMYVARGISGGGRADFERAVADARRVIELYPNRPRSYVDLADVLAMVGSREATTEAISQLEYARQLDGRRLPTETQRRFSPGELADIDQRIATLRARLK